MNNLYAALCFLGITILAPDYWENITPLKIYHPTSEIAWNEKGVRWLLDAQSENGGWGSGSHASQDIRDPHVVVTDPATTSFAAMALLEAGGPWKKNPYQKEIQKALDLILREIDQRPDNGRITSLTGTQPQTKLGMNIDASMALDFLTTMRKQIQDVQYANRIDTAATICISLLEGNQNTNGSWNNGGWAPVLQTAMANNALENAKTQYEIDDSILIRGSRYQGNNYYVNGIRISNDDAGVALYNAVSAQRVTAEDAKAVEGMLSEVTVVAFKAPLIESDNTTQGGVLSVEELKNLPSKSINALAAAIEANGVEAKKAHRMANAYAVHQQAKKELKKADVWNGFGNNGGEEFLSYKLHSESLEKLDTKEWKEWKTEAALKFHDTQNANGSWSGLHCITSPVFCTAAVLLAWYENPVE